MAEHLNDVRRVGSLAQLVEPANAKIILSAYLARAGEKPTAFVHTLLTVLISLARHYLEVPAAKLDALLAFRKKLGHTPPGLNSATRTLLRQLQNPKLRAKLLALPAELAESAHHARLSAGRRLLRMRTAVAIELLLQTGMRLGTLAALRVGQHLRWPDGRGGVLQIHLPQAGEDATYELTRPASELVHAYLDRFHPQMRDARGQPLLFVQHDGTPVTAAALADAITKALRRGLGIEMTPRDFRHLCAAIALEVRPEGLAAVKDLLGHRYLQTTQSMYAELQDAKVRRQWNEHLDAQLDHLNPGPSTNGSHL